MIVDASIGNEFKNEVIRGGISFLKVDAETDETVPQGLATLEGAEITVYNNSGNVVVIDGIEIENGEIVAVLTTDDEGRCGLDGTALSYGTYYAVETKASEGYLLSDWRIDFQIREDGIVIEAASDEYHVEASAGEEARSGWTIMCYNMHGKDVKRNAKQQKQIPPPGDQRTDRQICSREWQISDQCCRRDEHRHKYSLQVGKRVSQKEQLIQLLNALCDVTLCAETCQDKR